MAGAWGWSSRGERVREDDKSDDNASCCDAAAASQSLPLSCRRSRLVMLMREAEMLTALATS